MGNRAIVKPKGKDIGVYLHWNGGIDSVTAFLEYCKLKEHRAFGGKFADGYGIARFCQVVGNFFGGSLSIGIETGVKETKEYAEFIDNGIYIIDGWDVVDRICPSNHREGYDLKEMLLEIDYKQPEPEQLGEDYILAEVVDVTELETGDKVYILDYNGKPELFTVMGVDPVKGTYVNKYDHNGDYSWNGNNYIRGKVRKERYK